MKWWDGPAARVENGVKLVGICRLVPLYTKSKRRSIKEAVYFCLHSFRPMLTSDYDILVVDHIPYLQLFTAKMATWLKRKPLVADWLEAWGKQNWIKYLGFWKGTLAYWIEYISAKLPNNIFSISEFTSHRLVNVLRVPPDKIITVPCGIDFLSIDNSSSEPSKSSDCIFVGRLLEHKNVDKLLVAISELNKRSLRLTCVIIGQGPEYEDLRSHARKIGIESQVKFCGFVENQEEVFSYMKSSKLFVFPSEREGFGIVVLEANYCGLPVLAINHPDNAAKDLIQPNRNGVLCNSADPIELAEQIYLLFRDPAVLESMRQSSIEVAKQYSWDRLAQETLSHYQQIFKRATE